MRRVLHASFLLAILLGSNSCLPSFTAINHNEDSAALSAIIFAKESFIDLNQPGAYQFLSEDMQKKLSLSRFIEVVAQMHPQTFPRVVVATEFEPMPGEQSMFIWLDGKNEKERFRYRLTMKGSVSTGYKIAALFRVGKTPPSQMRRSLETRRSTDDLR